MPFQIGDSFAGRSQALAGEPSTAQLLEQLRDLGVGDKGAAQPGQRSELGAGLVMFFGLQVQLGQGQSQAARPGGQLNGLELPLDGLSAPRAY